jgi:uncharacterized protein (TIGR02145 family)
MTKQLFFIALFITVITFAQSPQKMSYQGVLRNSSSALITSAPVGMRISILQSSATGTVAYSETQSPTTNVNGLVSLEIGSGTPVTGTFAGITWANGPYFIKTETDPAGGTNYTITGTSQLMSMPYALYAANGITSVQASEITANTLKVGFTDALVSANTTVAGNTDKVGITVLQATAIIDLQAQVATLQAKISDLVIATAALIQNVTIGTQVWQLKNLDVPTYRDGTIIPEVTDQAAWRGLKTGAWCYNVKADGSTDGPTYGKLYNYYAVMGITVEEATNPTAAQIAARKQLAPIGWHIPSDTEWTTLTTFLGGENVAAGKMKETGTTFWASPNTDATNSSGFTGLPGGYRRGSGIFDNVSSNGIWWSSLENSTSYPWYRLLNYNNGYVIRSYPGFWSAGFSVRCHRD